MDLLQISQKIRQLRQAQGLTVEQLGTKCGVSKGFISQVENFRVTPSLRTISKIAAALGTDLAQLFSEDASAPEYVFGRLDDGEPVNRDEGTRYGIDYHALAYRQIGRLMEPFLIEYRPSGEDRDFMMHDTEEFYLLLGGELDFFIASRNEPVRMRAGDTLYMRANLPHRVRLAPGCTYAKALSVYTRPER